MAGKISDSLRKRFIHAVLNDHAEADTLLVENPELVNARGPNETSVIQFMTGESITHGVEFLAKRGANLDAKNGFGSSALLDAAMLGDDKIAAILLTHGANPNIVSSSFDTPIICAVQSASAKVVQLLLEHGADPAYRSPIGKTVFDVMPRQTQARFNIYKALEQYSPAKVF